MRFFALAVLPTLAMGAAVTVRSELESGAIIPDEPAAEAVPEVPMVPEPAPELPPVTTPEDVLPPTVDEPEAAIAPLNQKCASCSCVDIHWSHEGCGPDTVYTGKIDFSRCKSGEISWAGVCGDSSLLECPPGYTLSGGKCQHFPANGGLTVGPLAPGQSIVINVHDGAIAGNVAGNTPCWPIGGLVGGNSCSNNEAGSAKCERTFTAPSPPPECQSPPPEPEECGRETGMGGPGPQFDSKNWFMYAPLGASSKAFSGNILVSRTLKNVGDFSIAVSGQDATITYQFTDPKYQLALVSDNIKAQGFTQTETETTGFSFNNPYKLGQWNCRASMPTTSATGSFSCKIHATSSDVQYAAVHFDVAELC